MPRPRHRRSRPTACSRAGSSAATGARDASCSTGDFRSFSPRFQDENLERNLELVDALRAVAEARGATVAQVAIAWVLSRGEDVVPLVGARRRDRLHEALGALDLDLSAADLEAIEQAVPAGAAAGQRYAAAQMAQLDSERRPAGAAKR